MEWLWRGMTYGKFPSMRKEELALAATEGPLPGSSSVMISAAEGQQTATAVTPGKITE
jgi:hypothetical protein